MQIRAVSSTVESYCQEPCSHRYTLRVELHIASINLYTQITKLFVFLDQLFYNFCIFYFKAYYQETINVKYCVYGLKHTYMTFKFLD